jgi:hypothetical protein
MCILEMSNRMIFMNHVFDINQIVSIWNLILTGVANQIEHVSIHTHVVFNAHRSDRRNIVVLCIACHSLCH